MSNEDWGLDGKYKESLTGALGLVVDFGANHSELILSTELHPKVHYQGRLIRVPGGFKFPNWCCGR
jgi:hypothetical protein